MVTPIPEELGKDIEQYIEDHRPTLEVSGEGWEEKDLWRVITESDNPESAVFERLYEGHLDYECEMADEFAERVADEFVGRYMDQEETGDSREECKRRLQRGIGHHYMTCPDLTMNRWARSTDLHARVVIYSNYDCMNSHWLESGGPGGIGYDYHEPGYWRDLVDALQLNPRELQQALVEAGVSCDVEEQWIDRPDREPLITIQDFIQEMVNSCGCANLWVWPVTVSLTDVLQHPDPDSVMLEKGATCGLHDDFNGSGSLMEASLVRDVELELGQWGASDYDTIDLVPDTRGYGVQQVYGTDGMFTSCELKGEKEDDRDTEEEE